MTAGVDGCRAVGNRVVLPSWRYFWYSPSLTCRSDCCWPSCSAPCGGFGKWGLDNAETPGAPARYGFDEWMGFIDQSRAHFHDQDFHDQDFLWQD